MTQVENRPVRDAPALLLSWATGFLPRRRLEWGQAMQADLAGMRPRGHRWRFAVGCLRVVARRPAIGALGWPAVGSGVLIAAVVLTTGTRYLPMRVGLILMAVAISALSWLGHGWKKLGPAADGWQAAAVRTGGGLLVGCVALSIVLHDRSGDGNVVTRVSSGIPIFTVLLALYSVAFMALTAHHAGPTRGPALGAGLGLAGTLVWLIPVLSRPPIPPSSGWAFAVVLGVGLVAMALGATNGDAVRAGLSGGMVSALSIFVTVDFLLSVGPADWVPANSMALSAAARLAQSRVEGPESYLWILLSGAVLAAAALVAPVRSRPAPYPRPEQAQSRAQP